MIVNILLIVLIVSIGLVSIRTIIGPTIWDRLITFNVISAKVILVILCLSFLYDNTEYLDIALTYALLAFCSTVLIARFIEWRDHL
ncbi:multisubunit sodium/proton antiporter MrpF subunit [Natranaerovirga hydrolytica]|uniref:Multisubunit sodium/proton antiporter MrpF subunit n=1 Tax=Natranaerovirga hydrolytica TaxID=680378 RepID=A0A4R1N7E4_9FIRM|nr:monovalent cation/H+ antiporter complex subunit F [Natranaerovirga hydrolytica]TCK98583.1 multisubunit sodium/proton antiporter MrpF subunit [Natranaerovirga hydrolytica]